MSNNIQEKNNNEKDLKLKKHRFIITALISFSVISLEIIWTRIFSAEFYYTFGFLIISLTILGLGLGGLFLRLIPQINKTGLIWFFLLLTAFLAIIGPIIIMHINIDFNIIFSSWKMILKLGFAIFLLCSAFFTAGLSLSFIFKKYNEDMNKIYMFDLIGAAFGVLLSVLGMNFFGTPVMTVLVCLPIIISAFILSSNFQKIFVVIIALFAFFYIPYAEKFLEKSIKEHATVIHKHWDSNAKIKIYEYAPNYKGINIDNMANTPMIGFNGNWLNPGDSEVFQFSFPLEYLIKKYDSCVFLSLGSGGGIEVLQALHDSAAEVHAVEVNPYINKILSNGTFCDFTGKIYKDKRVKVITEDARSYIRRFKNKFDIINSHSSNTFAALASGSFALAENYLFTVEAFQEYYNALSPNGVFLLEHQFYIPRAVGISMEALDKLGVNNPKEHILVYDFPMYRRKVLLISKSGFTKTDQENIFFKQTAENYNLIHLLYPPNDSLINNPINRIVTKGWKEVSMDAKTDLSPCTDNKPFIAQMGLMKNFNFKSLKNINLLEFSGFPLAKIIISLVLLLVLFIVLPINILPIFKKSNSISFSGIVYFFLIGIGFMIVEIVLIQKYTLFIGTSSYAFVTILFTLLISSGTGSFYANKVGNYLPFIGIIIWLILEIFIFQYTRLWFNSYELYTRIIISVILIFPLGFFMGMPFTKGTNKVGEYIDWGFAINGAASVIGSTAILLVSFNFGFNFALMCGGIIYLLAYLIIINRNFLKIK